MRPRVPALRIKYRECVARLTAANIPVSLSTVSTDLSLRFHTVRNFLYRNPVLARELGLQTHEHHTSYDYIEAAKAIDLKNERITTYVLAAALGLDHSAVARYLRNNADTHRKIYEDTGQLVGRAPKPEGVTPKKLPNYLTKHNDKRAS